MVHTSKREREHINKRESSQTEERELTKEGESTQIKESIRRGRHLGGDIRMVESLGDCESAARAGAKQKLMRRS